MRALSTGAVCSRSLSYRNGHFLCMMRQVTPMQLATVYATIAAGGIYQKPHFITRVESQGHILEEQKVGPLSAVFLTKRCISETIWC